MTISLKFFKYSDLIHPVFLLQMNHHILVEQMPRGRHTYSRPSSEFLVGAAAWLSFQTCPADAHKGSCMNREAVELLVEVVMEYLTFPVRLYYYSTETAGDIVVIVQFSGEVEEALQVLSVKLYFHKHFDFVMHKQSHILYMVYSLKSDSCCALSSLDLFVHPLLHAYVKTIFVVQ